MTREIKFRGKRIDNGEWLYSNGVMIHSNGKVIMIFGETEDGFMTEPVHPETVGQYTGLKDKNGKEIFEGDIVFSEQYNPSDYVIDYVEGGFFAKHENVYPIDINHFYPSVGCVIEVIGNIHDVPNKG